MTPRQKICASASRIAHAAWDDRILRDGPLADQITAVANSRDMGTDGDLTSADCAKLQRLAERALEAGL
jgi:hypothetical protein